MEARFVTCCALVLAACLHSAVGTGPYHGKVVKAAMHATPAVYKVVDPTPEVLQYQIVSPASQVTVEEVRKVVAGPAPGCSITSCSQVSDGCGWCAKDAGYAVGYEKQVEVLSDKKRTTLTLKTECKGVFIFEASKCPSSVIAPKATAGAIHPTPQPPVVSAGPAPVPTKTVTVVEEPAEPPVEYVIATPAHYSHGHSKAGHHGAGHHVVGHHGVGHHGVGHHGVGHHSASHAGARFVSLD